MSSAHNSKLPQTTSALVELSFSFSSCFRTDTKTMRCSPQSDVRLFTLSELYTLHRTRALTHTHAKQHHLILISTWILILIPWVGHAAINTNIFSITSVFVRGARGVIHESCAAIFYATEALSLPQPSAIITKVIKHHCSIDHKMKIRPEHTRNEQ